MSAGLIHKPSKRLSRLFLMQIEVHSTYLIYIYVSLGKRSLFLSPGKCFDSINRVVFSETAPSEIAGMSDMIKEYVAFTQPVQTGPIVEKWLSDIEAQKSWLAARPRRSLYLHISLTHRARSSPSVPGGHGERPLRQQQEGAFGLPRGVLKAT